MRKKLSQHLASEVEHYQEESNAVEAIHDDKDEELPPDHPRNQDEKNVAEETLELEEEQPLPIEQQPPQKIEVIITNEDDDELREDEDVDVVEQPNDEPEKDNDDSVSPV